MTSLLDIAPLVGIIKLRDRDFDVPGISIEGIAYLIQRFPLIRAFVAQKDIASITPETILELAPEIVGAIVAVGLGHINSPDQERAVNNLSIGEKLACIEKILEVTIPQGAGPFVESLTRMASGVGDTGWARDTNSAAQSSS